MIRLLLIASFVAPFAVTACGDDGGDAEPFDTYMACFDDHHNEEGLTTKEAITVCCLDHPIGDHKPDMYCPHDEAACETQLRTDLDQTVTAADITTGCTDYLAKR